MPDSLTMDFFFLRRPPWRSHEANTFRTGMRQARKCNLFTGTFTELHWIQGSKYLVIGPLSLSIDPVSKNQKHFTAQQSMLDPSHPYQQKKEAIEFHCCLRLLLLKCGLQHHSCLISISSILSHLTQSLQIPDLYAEQNRTLLFPFSTSLAIHYTSIKSPLGPIINILQPQGHLCTSSLCHPIFPVVFSSDL